jgi:hypothetical protein
MTPTLKTAAQIAAENATPGRFTPHAAPTAAQKPAAPKAQKPVAKPAESKSAPQPAAAVAAPQAPKAPAAATKPVAKVALPSTVSVPVATLKAMHAQLMAHAAAVASFIPTDPTDDESTLAQQTADRLKAQTVAK